MFAVYKFFYNFNLATQIAESKSCGDYIVGNLQRWQVSEQENGSSYHPINCGIMLSLLTKRGLVCTRGSQVQKGAKKNWAKLPSGGRRLVWAPWNSEQCGVQMLALNAHEEWRWQTVTAHAEIFFVETWYSLDNLHDTPTFFLGLTSCQWNDPCTMGLISPQRHFLLSFLPRQPRSLIPPNTICWSW